ncbi:MAG: hypothetical protein EAZ74_04650 [Alphaproteobacteria bacterium]|nr:MAG: hypothetical protein EAY65_06025 [Alphaproteobacteria bacterium]TAE82247.1 MAG: hypothetical protein EAY76_03400 [Alphaproteobacteria bacterium]TAF14128.1 MAG: hypothetical protein EAZ74_04650 [Alphaproteobacteria bacterium]TAF39058.1 MAG: hypothetical protein EAZ66_05430 [Alphaproteobacteria bacterium]TAF75200.1 MAG: hypothetical protein EAZ52_07295 [Alphaproteobacteria bacterium]
MMKNIMLSTCVCLALLTACGGRDSYTSSSPWKETDKHLSCDQLLLEMNDARHWSAEAQKNKSFGLGDALWPVGYIHTSNSADEALEQTGSRLQHLNNIYKIKGCAKPYGDTPVPAPMGVVQ